MTTTIDLRPGDELPVLHAGPASRETLQAFAEASGDREPLHLDRDYARAAGMPDVFAHGLLVAAWLARLLGEVAPQDRLRSYRVRFLGITPVDARATCRGRVTDRRELEDGTSVADLELEAELDDGTVVCRAWATVAVSTGDHDDHAGAAPKASG